MQGENHVVLLKDNEIVEMSIDPEKYGFSRVKMKKLEGNSKENAKDYARRIERRKECLSRYSCIQCRSSSFRKWKTETIEEGIKLAAHSIDSGKALAKLNLLIAASNEKLERVN